MWPAMPIFELGQAIPVKSHVWKFGSDWLRLSRVISCPQTFFGGGQKPPLRGLHLTCDAHFRTRTCYSSQKSSVKIWFGLVEIGGMLSLRGVEDPQLLGGGGYMWPAMSIFELGRGIPVKSHMRENLVWIGWNRTCAFSVCVWGGGQKSPC